MFGYNGNTVNIADSIVNSIEIESPFLSFNSSKYNYYVSYYFDTKALIIEYIGDNKVEKEMIYEYWKCASERVNDNLKKQKRVYNYKDIQYEYFIETINVILNEMDGIKVCHSK